MEYLVQIFNSYEKKTYPIFYCNFISFTSDLLRKIIPLSFVADTSADIVINPEKAGYLVHEYYDLVFKQLPDYKSKKDLDFDDVLQKDVLREKFDPYARDEVKQLFRTGSDWINVDRNGKPDSNQLKAPPPVKEKKRDPRFELDPKEKEEYTRPTLPPVMEVMPDPDSEDIEDEDDVFLDA